MMHGRGREYIEQLGKALEDVQRTIVLPDGTVFERTSAIDHTLFVTVEYPIVEPKQSIVPGGWSYDGGQFRLVENNGLIIPKGVENQQGTQRYPTWVITDVQAQDCRSLTGIASRLSLRFSSPSRNVMQHFAGPWLSLGQRLRNPVVVPTDLGLQVSIDGDIVFPAYISLCGFIGFSRF